MLSQRDFLVLCFLFQAVVFLVALLIIVAFAPAVVWLPIAALYLAWFLRYLRDFKGEISDG
jgi:hypothetical protein